MKRLFLMSMVMAATIAARAEDPLRVAVLEFKDGTGMRADALQGGGIAPGAMADKGVFVLGKLLAGRPEFSLIDRRDLMDQLSRLQPTDMGAATSTKPSFLQAAQAVKADAVLRGTLLSLSSGKQTISQGGQQTDLSTLTVRVGLEALDARDGTVIAASDGVAKHTVRQTASMQEQLGEDDLFQLMEKAASSAIPALEKALADRRTADRARPTAKLAVKTSADPALVEIDGMLIGSTPIAGVQVYQGDHVVSITKPGHQPITKRILVEADMTLEIPMLRDQLSAEELKEIYEKGELIISTQPSLILHQTGGD